MSARYLKHFSVGGSPSSFPFAEDKCLEGDLLAWDEVDDVCYYIVGAGIRIEDSVTSFHGAMQVFNWNVHRDGQQPSVPTSVGLNNMLGPVIVNAV